MKPTSSVRISVFDLYSAQTIANQSRRKAAKNKGQKAFSKKMRRAERAAAMEFDKAKNDAEKAKTKSIVSIVTSVVSAVVSLVSFGAGTGARSAANAASQMQEGLKLATQLNGLASSLGSVANSATGLVQGSDTHHAKAISEARLDEKRSDRDLKKADDARQQAIQAQKDLQQFMHKIEQDKAKLLEMTT